MLENRIRRRLRTGKNFDIVSGCDLRDPREQHALLQYVEWYEPFMVIMAPMCTPFGPIGRFNRAINPEGWYRSLEDAVPLAYVCGAVALAQIKAGRHFLCENPHPTDLHTVHPWPLVMNFANAFTWHFTSV